MPVAMRSPSVGNDSEILAAPALETRLETLVRVSQAIAAHSDPKKLFSVLVDELQRVVQFDFIGVSFRDKDSDTFQNYFIDMIGRSGLISEEELTPEETLFLRVYERQEPVLRSTNEIEPCCARLQATLKRLHIRSICALPLTTAHRKLGAITFGSRQFDTYSADEVRFVSEVAGYIALAFDDALDGQDGAVQADQVGQDNLALFSVAQRGLGVDGTGAAGVAGTGAYHRRQRLGCAG